MNQLLKTMLIFTFSSLLFTVNLPTYANNKNDADFVSENSNFSDGYLVASLTKSGEEEVNKEQLVVIEESSFASASCVYSVGSEWDTGFVGNITITNNSNNAISDWSLSWEYTDGSTIDNLWNAKFSGSTPYTAKNLSWNGNIATGESVSFGFSGVKGGSAAEIATITSDICQ